MATVNRTTNNAFLDQQVETWAGLSTTNTTGDAAANSAGYGAASFQVEGTFGAGGTLVIEGSNDGANWHTLSNAIGGTALSLTAAAIVAASEQALYVRPRVTGGDGTTALNVTMVKNRAHPR